MFPQFFTRHLRAWSAVTLIAASACNSVTPVAAPTNEALTLTFWHAQTGVAAATLDAFADDFHKANPGIVVRGEARPNDGDLLRQGIAAMALNQLPDFIIASDRTVAEFARRDALAPLDGWLNDPRIGLSENERADLIPGLLDAGRASNQLRAFAFDARTVVLCYNANLLVAARADAPRTWDQFSAAARATTRANAHGWTMKPDARVFDALILGRGGSVLNAALTQAQFGDAAGMSVLQMIVALNRGGAATFVETEAAAFDEFAQGRATFLFVTTDQLPGLSDALARTHATFGFGIAPVPQTDPTRPVGVVFGSQIAVFKASDERVRAAWQFARWLVQPAQATRWTQATYALPTRLSARASLATDPNLVLLRGAWHDPLPALRAAPTVKDALWIDAAIVELWTSVAQTADIASALTRATTRVNRLLGQTP
ncbi:MAG: extracellular solute-binding protein [Chloroflexi bacterium]|nr:extracellular solute-binding protein [Chloroflexota bacterium]